MVFRAKPDCMIIPNISKQPFEHLHLDFGEFSKKKEGQKGTKSFPLVVDEHSKYVSGKAMKESSRAIIQYLSRLPYIHKVKEITTDNGTQFVSQLMKNFANARGIKLITSSPYHPAGNGLAERKLRGIKMFVSMYPSFRGGWKMCLEAALNHQNRSYCTSIGCSPNVKALGHFVPFPADQRYGITPDMVQEIPLSEETQQKYYENMKKNFDRHHAKNVPNFQVGDFILVQTNLLGKNRNVRGPFTIEKVTFFGSCPKTVHYEDYDGKVKIAGVKNVLPYHCRSSDIS